MTGKGAGSWATSYWKHNEGSDACNVEETYNGIVCSSAVQVRRVAFHGYEPTSYDHMEMKIARLDANTTSNSVARDVFLADLDNYSNVPWKPKQKPNNGHAIPFVTG